MSSLSVNSQTRTMNNIRDNILSQLP
jgi:hypothetical protein